MLLTGPSLGSAQEVDQIVLLVPVHDSVHLVLAMCQRQDLFAMNVHVHEVPKVAGGTVAQGRNCDVRTDIRGETRHRVFVDPASVVPTDAMCLLINEERRTGFQIKKVRVSASNARERGSGTRNENHEGDGKL